MLAEACVSLIAVKLGRPTRLLPIPSPRSFLADAIGCPKLQPLSRVSRTADY